MVGALATAIVAAGAHKAQALTKSGALAAFIAGTIAIAAGWSWGILLLAFFVSASALSNYDARRKRALTGSVVEKGGRRDAMQVAANGAVFTAAAAGHIFSGGAHWFALGIGAVAATTADTWATEIGTLGGRAPRLIVSGEEVPPGTSGGLTAAGTLGALAGSIFVAAGAGIAGWPVSFPAVVAGGLAGALGDSLLGATAQSKRFCDRCGEVTERRVHSCGSATTHRAGLEWLENDGVNLISTMIGALVTTLLARLGAGV